ncbi:MAG: divalent-cation tolerance protein CutA [Spirochaetia bacterium]|jgi:periplasmic divalent cation tolerance protein|nr:divalent-cation tolerance protein CutA [Spirochaetia bacterium]
MNDEAGVATISAPPREAKNLARILVETRAAACVQIIPGVQSVYWWNGAVQTDEEVLLVAKTLKSKLEKITALLKEHHPYELPELVFLPLRGGLEDYIAWIRESVSPAAAP